MRQSQCEKILEYMKTRGAISQAEAVEHFHCYRLGARIFDLKKRGIPIKTDIISGKTKDGSPYSFARYSFISEEANNGA